MQTRGLVGKTVIGLATAGLAGAMIGGAPAGAETTAGGTWTVVASPNLGGLRSVATTSASDAWAVGSYYSTTKRHYTLSEHWNGTAWTQVPTPSPGRANPGDILYGVAATSADDAWAVGAREAGDSVLQRTLIEHWDGTAWAVIPSPNPGGYDSLYGVAATSADDAWAVGSNGKDTLVEHWNGTSWVHVPSPTPAKDVAAGLDGVTATSATDVWAVGLYYTAPGSNGMQTLIEHWNGTTWTRVPSPSPGDGYRYLAAVAATSATNAWAVGSYQTGRGSQLAHKNLIEHWNGTAWKMVPSPDPSLTVNLLAGVAATAARNAWAVGTDNAQTVLLQWNGTAWTQIPSPNPGSTNALTSVAASSATNAWAVGTGSPLAQSITIHCC